MTICFHLTDINIIYVVLAIEGDIDILVIVVYVNYIRFSTPGNIEMINKLIFHFYGASLLYLELYCTVPTY